jgi:hypothetical protein
MIEIRKGQAPAMQSRQTFVWKNYNSHEALDKDPAVQEEARAVVPVRVSALEAIALSRPLTGDVMTREIKVPAMMHERGLIHVMGIGYQ